MTIGSLFSGIGGLELGLEWAGLGPVIWQIEKDPFCRSVLAKHWPDVPRFCDVTTVRNLPFADVLCGGFPCQDVSAAGRGAGLQGERSGLWWYFAAIIDQVRPRWVVVENVASGARRWLPTVRRHLHLLGYDSTAYALSAAVVGAPHLRKRIFVVAHAHAVREPARPFDAEVARASASADADEARREGPGDHAHEGWPGSSSDPWRAPVSGLVPMVHGVPGGVAGRRRRERIRALGNSVVPQCAEVIGRIIADQDAS